MNIKEFLHLVLLLTITDGAGGQTYSTQIVSGIYKEELSDPIFYNSFIPIIYEYSYPSWSILDITLRDWRGTCQSDDFAPSYTCPVFFYFERFIERMQNEIVRQTTKSFAHQVPAEMNNITSQCYRIQRHFHSLLTSKSSLDSYLRTLSVCPVQGQVVRRSIQDYVYGIKTIYRMMVSKFEAEFSNKAGAMGTTDRFGPAYYVNQITASQGIMMFNYWIEHARWETAAHACSLEMIPTSLIKPANLTSSLQLIEIEAAKQKYSLSISRNETGIYLISPVADCTFTDQNSFMVRILVPVRRKSFNPKLIKLQAVPFLLNDNNNMYSVCQILDIEGTYVYDEISGYLVISGCEAGKLCQIEEQAGTPLPHFCASAYFSGVIENIKRYCHFDCEKVSDGLYPVLPIFRKVSSDTFTVTGNSNLELMVKCEGKRDQIINPDELGALEIILPCDCTLNFRSQMFLSERPCGDHLSVRVILPIQFFSDQFVATGGKLNGTPTADILNLKYFRGGGESIVSIQQDISSGNEEMFEVFDKSQTGRLQSTSASSSIAWLWALFVMQTICVTGCLIVVFKRLDFAPWTSLGRSASLRFSNPSASGSSQNISGRDKHSFVQVSDSYEI